MKDMYSFVEEKQIKIDVKDEKILTLLSENSKEQITQVAKKVGLAKDTVRYRIKRLEKLKAIRSCYPELNITELGFNLYHIFLLLDEKNKEKVEECITALKKHKNTHKLIEYSDRWDIKWTFIARSIQEYDEITSTVFSQFASIISEREAFQVIREYKTSLLPFKHYTKSKITKKKSGEISIDEEDKAILKKLSDNARASTYEVAKHTSLSPDSVGLRIKKMKKSGVIKRFTIYPAFHLLNHHVYTFAMEMKTLDKKEEAKVKAFVKQHQCIAKAEKTMGKWDVILHITADTPRQFHKVVKEIKNQFADNLSKYDMFIMYRELYFQPVPQVIVE